jgi:hypothetical protein
MRPAVHVPWILAAACSAPHAGVALSASPLAAGSAEVCLGGAGVSPPVGSASWAFAARVEGIDRYGTFDVVACRAAPDAVLHLRDDAGRRWDLGLTLRDGGGAPVAIPSLAGERVQVELRVSVEGGIAAAGAAFRRDGRLRLAVSVDGALDGVIPGLSVSQGPGRGLGADACGPTVGSVLRFTTAEDDALVQPDDLEAVRLDGEVFLARNVASWRGAGGCSGGPTRWVMVPVAGEPLSASPTPG